MNNQTNKNNNHSSAELETLKEMLEKDVRRNRPAARGSRIRVSDIYRSCLRLAIAWALLLIIHFIGIFDSFEPVALAMSLILILEILLLFVNYSRNKPDNRS